MGFNIKVVKAWVKRKEVSKTVTPQTALTIGD
jgi:hypothetical protein